MTEPEPRGITPEAAIVQASNYLMAMALQRLAKDEVLREAQAAIDNAEWNALTPQEQEDQMARNDAAYEAYYEQRVAEMKEEAELYAEQEIDDPEAEIG